MYQTASKKNSDELELHNNTDLALNEDVDFKTTNLYLKHYNHYDNDNHKDKNID